MRHGLRIGRGHIAKSPPITPDTWGPARLLDPDGLASAIGKFRRCEAMILDAYRERRYYDRERLGRANATARDAGLELNHASGNPGTEDFIAHERFVQPSLAVVDRCAVELHGRARLDDYVRVERDPRIRPVMEHQDSRTRKD